MKPYIYIVALNALIIHPLPLVCLIKRCIKSVNNSPKTISCMKNCIPISQRSPLTKSGHSQCIVLLLSVEQVPPFWQYRKKHGPKMQNFYSCEHKDDIKIIIKAR